MADEKIPDFLAKRRAVRSRPDRSVKPVNTGGSSDSGSTSSSTTPVKTATPDLIVFEETLVDADTMVDLIFEDIGGQEIIDISRNDLIDGQNTFYKPIKNVSAIYSEYNPQNILAIGDSSRSYFDNFPIKIDNYIPQSISDGYPNNIYIELNSGDLIIELENLPDDEQVQVQIFNKISGFNDTIYVGEES